MRQPRHAKSRFLLGPRRHAAAATFLGAAVGHAATFLPVPVDGVVDGSVDVIDGVVDEVEVNEEGPTVTTSYTIRVLRSLRNASQDDEV
jgi:hypothetical protein